MSFIYFRKPHETTIYRNRCTDDPEELSSLADLDGREGFVIAPFAVTDECPILLLKADFEEISDLYSIKVNEPIHGQFTGINVSTKQWFNVIDPAYATAFRIFHEALASGRFAKLVLSRCATFATEAPMDALALFRRACEMYPRMYIALFSTRQSGTWIIASPEVLLSGNATDMHTMALAGTMPLTDADLSFDTRGATVGQQDIKWSSKNIQEQRYVETYITDTLSHFTDHCNVDGPYTVRAANLVHLRSDISFTLPDATKLGSLLDNLHPTPAVCGIPKQEAAQFIIDNEHYDRRYYSGFSGLLSPTGLTDLYVTLRCMEVQQSQNTKLNIQNPTPNIQNPTPNIQHPTPNIQNPTPNIQHPTLNIQNTTPNTQYRLYAGGGILPTSVMQSEWEETEAKMQTMRSLL